jgi:hypothetical protein
MAMLASGCGVVWDAPESRLVLRPTGVAFASDGDREAMVGGETFIEVVNDTDKYRRIVLAEVDRPGELPQELLDAEFPRDDGRILDMTGDMRPKRPSLVSALTYEYAIETFHVHLDEGSTYVVFDTEHDAVELARWFQPGPDGAIEP